MVGCVGVLCCMKRVFLVFFFLFYYCVSVRKVKKIVLCGVVGGGVGGVGVVGGERFQVQKGRQKGGCYFWAKKINRHNYILYDKYI